MPRGGREWFHEAGSRSLTTAIGSPPKSSAVWLYHLFSLSLRDIELILAARGIVVSDETVRRWCKKFASSFADRLRGRRPRPGDKWHMHEVFIRTQGVQHYLRRAVDQDGVVLDIPAQARRERFSRGKFRGWMEPPPAFRRIT
jgi:putative transposase